MTRIDSNSPLNYIQNKISDVKTELPKVLAQAKKVAVSGKHMAQEKLGTISLNKLFPPELKGVMSNAKETVTQNYMIRAFSKAFSSVLKKENTNLDHKITLARHEANKEGPPFLDSSKVVASQKEMEEFKSSRESGLIATHFKTSHADVKGKTATEVRDRFNSANKEGKFNSLRGRWEKTKAERRIKYLAMKDEKGLSNEEVTELKSKRLEEDFRKMSKESKDLLSTMDDEEIMALQFYSAEGDYRIVNTSLDGDQFNKKTWLENRSFSVPQPDGKTVKKPYKKLSDSEKKHVDNEVNEAAKQVAHLTASALNKLPQYGGTVYRSELMKPDELAKCLKPGEVIVRKKFLSTTKSKEQAVNFGITDSKTDENGNPLMKVVFEISASPGKKLRGADITHLSTKEEEEVLLNHGSMFVSTGYKKVEASGQNQAYVIIQLRQLTEEEING